MVKLQDNRKILIDETLQLMKKEGIEMATAREIYTHIVMKFPDKSKQLGFKSSRQLGRILEYMTITFSRASDTSPKIYHIK